VDEREVAPPSSSSAPVTVVKLGGSIISDKRKDFSYRGERVAALARAILSSGQRTVVVHGGGAFGHPLAKRYHLSSRSASPSPDGVSETRRAMFDLNARICGSMAAEGLHPYTFSPFPLLTSAGAKGRAWLGQIVSAGLTPVTFGDVVHEDGGFRILSGDTIVRLLSRSLRAARCVFVMDVDGILGPDGAVAREIDRRSAARLEFSASGDATGGIALKVREALKIASGGTEVAFVSGFKPHEFSKALKGLDFYGTIVRVPSRD
jgi:isopentenyl phosphate kinase